MAQRDGGIKADVDLCVFLAALLDDRLGRFRDRHEAFHQQGDHPRHEDHNGRHRDGDGERGGLTAARDDRQTADEADAEAEDRAEDDRLKDDAPFAELFLQVVDLDVDLVEARDDADELVEHIAADAERQREAVRRRAAGQVHEFLEIRSREIGEHEADDHRQARGDEGEPDAARQRRDVAADKGVLPEVPDVDVDRLRRLRDEHEDVDEQAERDDEDAHLAAEGDRRRARPADINDAQVDAEAVRHGRRHRHDGPLQQRQHQVDADEAHAHEQRGAQGFRKARAEADAHDQQNDRHENARAEIGDRAEKARDRVKYRSHFLLFLLKLLKP